MSSNNLPATFPLQGIPATYDCRMVNGSSKLSDSWLHNEYQKLSLISPDNRNSVRESRKRIRNVGDREVGDDIILGDRDSTESCDDMIISDTDTNSQISGFGNGSGSVSNSGLNLATMGAPTPLSNSFAIRENSLIHPPKRRLTSVVSANAGGSFPVSEVPQTTVNVTNHNENPHLYSNTATNTSTSRRARQVSSANQDQHISVHPRTPNALDSPTNTPVSDIDEQPQQLPLPSPSASPVQSGQDKPAVFDPIENALSNTPTTQQELLDLIVNLSGYLHESNKNNLIFQLLQGANRSSLSSFNGIIHDSLKRDLISNLPLEISYNILSLLDCKSLLSGSLVCTNWNKIIDNADIWTQLIKKDKLLNDDDAIDEELANPRKLINEWAADPNYHLKNMNIAQFLYKKRSIILRRWMTPWYQPKRISVPSQGSNVVTCLQHDDEKIITGIDDKLINIYSTKTGELLKVLKGHEGGVWALKYTGNTLVSGSTDRSVRVWNIKTGKCTHVFRGHTSTVRCLDILHPVKIGKNDKGEDIIFPEVPLLVTGSRDHNLHVWKLPLDNENDPDLYKLQQVYDSTETTNNPYLVAVLTGHSQSVRSVTGYGNIIVSGSYDTTVRVWDLLEENKCKFILEGHSDRIYSTALNFQTKRCYSGSMDSSINVWDIEKGELLYSLEGHSSLVGLLELSDDYLVSAAADSTLRVWDPQSPENFSKLKGHSNAITCFQHDSLRVVSGSERMLKLWNIETGQFVRDLLADITGGIWQVRFDVNRCVAAVQRTRGETEETFIEILDFSVPPSRESFNDGRKIDVIELLPYDGDNMEDEGQTTPIQSTANADDSVNMDESIDPISS